MMQGGPQRSSSNTMWIVLGLLAVLLTCCCGGGIAYLFFMRSAASSLVPPTPSVGDPVPVSSGVGPTVPDSAGSGAAPAGTSSVTVTLTVTSATGVPAVTPGTVCTFPVVYHPDSGDLNCQAHVTCAGVALYGDTETNGFFPCSFSASPASVSGADTQMSGADQDPSFSISSTAGTVVIADDAAGHHGAFNVTGTIQVQ